MKVGTRQRARTTAGRSSMAIKRTRKRGEKAEGWVGGMSVVAGLVYRAGGGSRSREQVRSAKTGALERLKAAPAGDLGVVAAQQDVGHAPTSKLHRAGVVRILEQPAGM